MDSSAYKTFHESFMQNNNGTTIEEVFATIVPTVFTMFLSANLILLSQPLSAITSFAIEFIAIITSTVLNVTVLNDRIWEIAVTLCLIVITAISKQLYQKTHIMSFVQIPCRRPGYLTLIRSILSVITAICILAVDFKCFPRKLAKTETFGFGLMDTGVGLFVFGNAIAAPELYRIDYHQTRLSWRKIKNSIISSLPLFVLGFGRFFLVNELDYHQHVSEYGAHWNFFVTLALTKLLATIVIGLLPKIEYTKYAALAICTAHELTLQTGLSNYVIDPSKTVTRKTFIDANREGIFSIPGYVAIYLASVYVGHIMKHNARDEKEDKKKIVQYITVKELLKKSFHMLVISCILWKVVYTVKNMFGVSRRLANMGYVLWTVSVGTSLTTILMFFEIFFYFIKFDNTKYEESDDQEEKVKFNAGYIPDLMSGVAYNALAFFLIANVLTGLINIAFQTLLVNNAIAIIILLVYMFVLCSITTFLYKKQIKLKAW